MTQPDTILAHPALAGRTLLTGRGNRWTAWLIRPEGSLAEARVLDRHPAEFCWRNGRAA